MPGGDGMRSSGSGSSFLGRARLLESAGEDGHGDARPEFAEMEQRVGGTHTLENFFFQR